METVAGRPLDGHGFVIQGKGSVASDHTDTEFFIKISEQLAVPEPREFVMHHLTKDAPAPSTMVTRGWAESVALALDQERGTPLRRYHVDTDPRPITPDTIISYDVEIRPTSYPFRKGNRIRFEIANGDSMVADGLFHHYYGCQAGRDLYYHDDDHPSHVLLPVVHTEG